MRKTVFKIGPSRATVRGFTEGDLMRVQWRVRGKPVIQSWPNTAAGRKEARAFAEGLLLERTTPKQSAPLSLREVWDAFVLAEFPHLRPTTRKLYTEYWRRWENMWGRGFTAQDATVDMLREMRRAMSKLGLSVTTTRETVKVVKMVYAWAQREKKIATNELYLFRFKVAKEDKVESPAEYRPEEFRALLAALDPKNGLEWRPYVALSICGFQGVRQNAALHLRWDDIDLVAKRVRWRAEWDKMGRDWWQPLRVGTLAALEVAAANREEGSPWVLPSRKYSTGRVLKGETYTIQSLWSAVKAAEKRAGIKHIARRAGHGLRRGLSTEVAILTGDPLLAMQAIGDTDVRQAERYVKKRDERVTALFATMDNPEEK